MAAELRLDVVTPEKSIARDVIVDSVILPGELGQMNILPGHRDLMSSLSLGSFAYRVAGEWRWAFLSGGFAQILGGRITVLAETMDLAHEIDVAAAELELVEIGDRLKKIAVGSAEYPALAERKRHAESRLQVAKKYAS